MAQAPDLHLGGQGNFKKGNLDGNPEPDGRLRKRRSFRVASELPDNEAPVLSTEPGLRFETAMASSVASRNEKQGDAEAAPNQCDRAQKQDCRIQLTAALQFHVSQ